MVHKSLAERRKTDCHQFELNIQNLNLPIKREKSIKIFNKIFLLKIKHKHQSFFVASSLKPLLIFKNTYGNPLDALMCNAVT